jgi:glycosyltransferase involved in cell wall biosynthesis
MYEEAGIVPQPDNGRRIFLLNTLMEAGGAQKAMLQLARGLASRGHYVRVATMYDKGGFVPRFEERFGLEITDLRMKRPGTSAVPNAVWAVRGVRHLRRALMEHGTEVLQTFSHYSNVIGPIVARTAGVPVCVSSQRMRLQGRPWVLRAADRWTVNRAWADRMVAVSDAIRDYCVEDAGIRADRIVTIPNGLDVSEMDRASDSADRIIDRKREGLGENDVVASVVARLHPQKGHIYLLEAVADLIGRHPRLRVLLIGEGNDRGELGNRITDMGLEKVVRLLGDRHDVPELLAISDLFVLPSLWEGMPNAVLEAMAARLPVVATAVDGTAEVVVHGETGWLVPPADSAALARAVEEALTDVERRRKLGVAGRRRVEMEFTLDRYVDRFEELYEALLCRGTA